MSKSTIKLDENPITPVVLTLAISAALGGAIAVGVGTLIAMGAIFASGPLGWLIFGPALLATAITALMWVTIGAPLLAVLGGYLVANNNTTQASFGALAMGVTFFHEEHAIHKKVQELTWALKLPPIRHVGWFADDNINAFAMGLTRDNALLAFSQGAIDKLTKEEFNAVIAHELAHVANGDMRNMTFAHGAQEALTFFLVFRGLKRFAKWLFYPFAQLNIMHYSRSREFVADNVGAELASPEAMIGALKAIKAEKITKQANSHLDCFKLSSAFQGHIWSTHPPLCKRIKAIEAKAAEKIKHSTFPAKQNAPSPQPVEVITIKEIPEIETQSDTPLQPWASAGLMSFGS